MVKVETIVQKNICHDSFIFQKEETSSIANNNPPTGAPKADATPAPAPAEMKLRLQKGEKKIANISLQYYLRILLLIKKNLSAEGKSLMWYLSGRVTFDEVATKSL